MFEAKIIKGEILKKAIEAIKDLIQEATLDCSENGISLQAMDTSHVSLVSLLLRSEGFETYRCDRNINLGLNVVSVSKILKCLGSNDSLTMKAADSNDTISFLIESSNESELSEFEIKLMDIEGDHLGIPDTEYKCIVKMPSAKLQKICKEMSQMGEAITITVAKDGVTFVSTGDIGNGKTTLHQNSSADKENEGVTIEMTEPVSMTYSLRYFNMFAKAAPLSPIVSLSLTENVPAVVEFLIDDIGYIRYYLAPKIEDDE
uniref:DNA sliding clamp PCNA n=1 Tax=Dugesia japonica TaxID=6161 RepID=Q5H7M5_DUGJA|nr:proliferating cell nuclear antigen [Dugesia japonica]